MDCVNTTYCTLNVTLLFQFDSSNTYQNYTLSNISRAPFYPGFYELLHPISFQLNLEDAHLFIPLQFQGRFYNAYEEYYPGPCQFSYFIGPCFDWKHHPWESFRELGRPESNSIKFKYHPICCLDEFVPRGQGQHCLAYDYQKVRDKFSVIPSPQGARVSYFVNVNASFNQNFTDIFSTSTLDAHLNPFLETINDDFNFTLTGNISFDSEYQNWISKELPHFVWFEKLDDIIYHSQYFPALPDDGFPFPHVSNLNLWTLADSRNPYYNNIGKTASQWAKSADCNHVRFSDISTINPLLFNYEETASYQSGDIPRELTDQFHQFNTTLVDLLAQALINVTSTPLVDVNTPTKPSFSIPIYSNDTIVVAITVSNIT